jgi:hypothetical protein
VRVPELSVASDDELATKIRRAARIVAAAEDRASLSSARFPFVATVGAARLGQTEKN